jgi:hypothetical protein
VSFLPASLCRWCFPTIFALGLKGLGPNTKIGGSLLVMAIVGGAVLTPLMGLVSELGRGIALAYCVPLVSYVYIALYSFFGSKQPRALEIWRPEESLMKNQNPAAAKAGKAAFTALCRSHRTGHADGQPGGAIVEDCNQLRADRANEGHHRHRCGGDLEGRGYDFWSSWVASMTSWTRNVPASNWSKK